MKIIINNIQCSISNIGNTGIQRWCIIKNKIKFLIYKLNIK